MAEEFRPKGSRVQVRRSAQPKSAHAEEGSRRGAQGVTYGAAGVNLTEKDEFTESIVSIMRRTFGPRVIDNPGGFAGLFRLDYNEKLFARNYRDPVLVACADGVGTKVKLAAAMGRFDTIGIDLVAMNVNDMIVQGAEPLFFLDYIAVGKVDKGRLREIVRGVAEGCRRAGCALLGGETAEMPGVYAGDDFDLAGFAVGVVELARAVNPTRVEAGDIVLGLGSNGIHSNGYSLVRRIVEECGLDLEKVYPELGEGTAEKMAEGRAEGAAGKRAEGRGRSRGARASANGRAGKSAAPTLGEVLLMPTRIYVRAIVRVLSAYRVKKVVGGMAHITGSGMVGNLERALHPGVDAVVERSAWPVPAVFRFLQKQGRVDEEEMRRVFNMGIGFCLIVRPSFAASIREQLQRSGERVYEIGKIVKGTGKVRERQ